MKLLKKLGLLTALLVLPLLLPLTAEAEEVTQDGLTYETYQGTAIVQGCDTTRTGQVTIPSTIGGCTVTAIGENAFWGCSEMTAVTIPDTVQTLGECAFLGCTGLKEITLPDSITAIGEAAFYGCTALEKIEFPENLSAVGEQAFDGTLWLDAQKDSVVYVGKVLYGCQGNHEARVVIREGTVAVAREAFYDCTVITGVTMPKSLRFIGRDAFCCENMERMDLTDLSAWCAVDLENERSTPVDYYHDVDVYLNGSLVSGTLTIPSDVTAIKDYTFRNWDHIDGLVIPDNVVSIGKYSFGYCTDLSWVSMTDGVTSIQANAFNTCNGLGHVYYEGTQAQWEALAGDFAGETLARVKIHCGSARPDFVVDQFCGYDSMRCLLCDAYFSANENAVAHSYEDGFCLSCGLPQYLLYRIYHQMNSFYASVENYLGKASTLVIPETICGFPVTHIQSVSDYNYTPYSLNWLYLPATIESIESMAFYNAVDGQVPEHVFFGGTQEQWETIEIEVANEELLSATRHYEISQLPLTATDSCLYRMQECGICHKINVEEKASAEHQYEDGCCKICGTLEALTYRVEANEEVTIIGYYGTNAALAIPERIAGFPVTAIADEVFAYNSWLESIMIPKTVKSIGNSAFYSCSVLSEVYLNKGLETIGDAAFNGCPKLETLTVPEGVRSIGDGAFAFCGSLTDITLPDSLTTLDGYAFQGCSKLQSIRLPANLTTLEAGMLSGCSALESITLPESLKVICSDAFMGCRGLRWIFLPAGLESVGGLCFADCDALEHVLFGGTESQWQRVNIGTENEKLRNATLHCQAEGDEVCVVDGELVCALCSTEGWYQENGRWYYLQEDGSRLTNCWKEDSLGWCYLGEDGYCVTDTWKADSVGWCYLDSNGRMAVEQWIRDSVGWCYLGADGYCVTDAWRKDSKGWCYLDSNGRMAVEQWIRDSAGWCYVGSDGYCVTDAWRKDSKGWCYLDSNGRMAVERWVRDSVGWCYVGSDGYAVTECWKQDSVGWCYLDSEGSMTKNAWVFSGGKWYWLNAEGYMATNCEKDGGWIGADGIWKAY